MKWETVNLGDVLHLIIGGGTPSKSKSEYWNGDIFWCSVKDMEDDKHYLSYTKDTITKKGLENSSANLIKAGTVITSTRMGLGRAFINKVDMAINQDLKALIPNERIDNRFLLWTIVSKRNELNMLGRGSTVKGITLDILKSIEIALPPLIVQRRIADILSAYDDLIENNQKQIKLLEEAAMRLYKEWFVNLRFPGYENTKIVDGVPDGWSRKKLIDIADITMGQSPKSEYYNDKQQGLPFHQGVTNYGYRFVIDDTYSTSYTRIAEAGSILFSVRAPVGRMNITKNKIVIGRGLAAINHREGLQSFLFYMLKNRFYKDDLIGNGAIYASITKSALHSQEFLIPSDNLANKFNSVAKSIDQQITNADRQIILLKQARDKLLPKLMNGDIEV
ncbi:restriction endonuclease subunit S [Xylanivirga thermophila]|jgi:type I restriction enzyme S subunit|uniref:restriction endonuclease subunit S n=1 Tax=Xylanivirga thermophila TaxID=2496273 RepID=UPI00101DD049|nr:restriction endonuclease subunit S [Xylanivirga thermophila]